MTSFGYECHMTILDCRSHHPGTVCGLRQILLPRDHQCRRRNHRKLRAQINIA